MNISDFNQTLEALVKSIDKYKTYSRKRTFNNVNLGSDNCELCKIFFNEGCKGCPVKSTVGRSYCEATPYSDVSSDWHTNNIFAFRASCKDEAQFLTDILCQMVFDYLIRRGEYLGRAGHEETSLHLALLDALRNFPRI